MPAAAGFVTDPRTGEPGVRVTLPRPRTAPCSRSGTASTRAPLVGFDDDFPRTVASVHSVPRLEAAGRGGRSSSASLGVGDWQLRPAADELARAGRRPGTGIGEEFLAPPIATAGRA